MPPRLLHVSGGLSFQLVPVCEDVEIAGPSVRDGTEHHRFARPGRRLHADRPMLPESGQRARYEVGLIGAQFWKICSVVQAVPLELRLHGVVLFGSSQCSDERVFDLQGVIHC